MGPKLGSPCAAPAPPRWGKAQPVQVQAMQLTTNAIDNRCGLNDLLHRSRALFTQNIHIKEDTGGECAIPKLVGDMTKVSCAINLILRGSGCILFSVLSSGDLVDHLMFHCLACGTSHFCC